MNAERASASSSSSSEVSVPQWKYHLFVNFRGEDTRKGFVSHLYHEFESNWPAIKIFKDDCELERGKSISLELLRAINQSQFAIVVLSPNYASSTWCLGELREILQCMEARDTVFPVFYDVNPCDVRKQQGSFAKAFAMYDRNFSDDVEKVNQWKSDLTKLASLSGWDLKNYRCERDLIKDIASYVGSQVLPAFTSSVVPQRLSASQPRLLHANPGSRYPQFRSTGIPAWTSEIVTKGPSLAEDVFGEIARSAKRGYEHIFQKYIQTVSEEQILKSFACCTFTSVGPVQGTLYSSTSKLAFCSEYPLPYKTGNQTTWSYYKVSLPLYQLKAVNSIPSISRIGEKYIHIISTVKTEFWFMNFLQYDSALKDLQEAVLPVHSQHQVL